MILMLFSMKISSFAKQNIFSKSYLHLQTFLHFGFIVFLYSCPVSNVIDFCSISYQFFSSVGLEFFSPPPHPVFQGGNLFILNVSSFLMCMHADSFQCCLTLCDLMDCSPPGSFVHGLSRQEYWSGLPSPPPGDLSDAGVEPMCLSLQNWQTGS